MSIVLNIHEPWHYSNWEPVVRHLDPGEARIWVTPWVHRSHDLVAQQRALARTLGWLEHHGIEGLVGDLPFDPGVLGTLAIEERMVPPERSMQVRMLYAVISKKYTYSELNRLCDAVMVASEFGRSLMDRHGVRAHVVGYPKLDDVFNGVLTREVARQRLGLDPERQVVLYAPTFAGMSSVDRFAAAFDTLDDSLQLLVQLHPVSYVKELARYGRLGERFPGRVRAGGTDPRGFALVADVTPLGMRAGDPLPVAAQHLTPAQTVASAVTKPEITPLLAAARERGCTTMSGQGMFDAQAVLLVDTLTGRRRID